MWEVTKLHIVNTIHKYWGLLCWGHQKDQLFISTSILPYFARTVSTYLLKTTVSRTVQSILGASPIVKQRLKISRFHKHLCCVRWKSCPKTIAPSVKPLTFFGIWIWSLRGPKKQSLHSSWNCCRNLFTENVAKML